jgi:hypothetical protein
MPGRPSARRPARPGPVLIQNRKLFVSDHAHLARTGTIAIVIGGAVISGWYLLAVAGAVIAAGALLIRFGFRRGRNAGQQ